MKKAITLSWRPIYIAHALVLLSVILLFFTGRYEAGFSAWMHDDGTGDVLPGLSLHKLVLFVLDMSLWAIIVTPLKVEDERVDKIRAFALKQTFFMMLIAAGGLGLLMNVNFSLLNYALIVEAYYLLLFQICLFRDSRIVYLTTAKQDANMQATRKKRRIYPLLIGMLMGFIPIAIAEHYHRPELVWISIAILIGVITVVITVYASWKK